MTIFITVILLVFLYDFTRLRQQNERMIEQNEKMILLLEELSKRGNE
ncbi:hypothetical protein M3204_17120 [Mesobacillus subterraneus]|nr:hypothetical protein [Mesobacillus subterraneus]MCM3666142.1 hypothetical protein [Mesobacillus subterraneus]MCM3685140.1 hypothetical protein [Mesobacillus subterraneus]